MTTTTATKTNPIRSMISNIRHEIRCLLGKEVKTTHFEAGKPTIMSRNCMTGKDTVIQEGSKSKTRNTYEEISKSEAVSVAKPVNVHFRRGLGLVMPIALLVVRHFVPEISESLPHVYALLDEIVIPIIDWSYKLCMKVLNIFVQKEWFQKIIETLANLAN